MKQIPHDTVENVISLLDSDHSTREISQETGISKGSVTNIANKHRPERRKRSAGRPPMLSKNDVRFATRAITSGKVDNAVQATQILRSITNQSLSTQTTRRALKNAGLKSAVKAKKPLLLPRHRKARMNFATAYQDWTMEDWKRVIWSDESKMNRFGSDGRHWVWKRPGEPLADRHIEPTLKFGGGHVMIWGCMTWQGVGNVVQIEGKMDQHLYRDILAEDLVESVADWGLKVGDVVFQQDGDPKHTARIPMKWLEDHGYTILLWPAQSPDLNPIEHLWQHVKRKLAEYETPSAGIIEHWERIQKVWLEIPASVCQNLIASMPERVQAVLKAKGGHTTY